MIMADRMLEDSFVIVPWAVNNPILLSEYYENVMEFIQKHLKRGTYLRKGNHHDQSLHSEITIPLPREG